MNNYNDGNNVKVNFFAIERTTDKAHLLLMSKEDYQGIWIPSSQIAHIDEDTGEFWIPLWLAEKNGLEYE